MKYAILTISFSEFPKRLNRKIKVREDLDLFTLGVVLGVILGADFTYDFAFISKNRNLVMEKYQQLFAETDDYMTNYHLKDLGTNFTFLYDTSNSWVFQVKVEKELEEMQSRKKAFIIDAIGQGIWEDNLAMLRRYLSGELKDDIRKEKPHSQHLHLWDKPLEKVADFDFPLDLIGLNLTLENRINTQLDILEENGVF